MTNGEKIRGMTDEELAKFLSEFVDYSTCCIVNPKNYGTEETCEKSIFNLVGTAGGGNHESLDYKICANRWDY